MGPLTLPAAPPPVPALRADPGGIRAYAGHLLAASVQVDDLAGLAAGTGRLADWRGAAADSYRAALEPVGRRADAASLALRDVARRVEAHADAVERLLIEHADLTERRGHLLGAVDALRERAGALDAGLAAAWQAEADACAREVADLAADVASFARALEAEEEDVRRALAGVVSLAQVERRWGGVPDPADAALATMPGADAPPAAVAAWWAGLAPAARAAVVAASPDLVGSRDGLPAGVRDRANRLALERDLADGELLVELGGATDEQRVWLANARAARDALAAAAATVDPVSGEPAGAQLYAYDPTAFGGDGLVAVAVGDLDTADDVAVTVPGLGTDAGSAPYLGARAGTLYEAARFVDGSRSNATLAWLGYDAPDNLPWQADGDASGVLDEALATRGGERLADTLDGLRAARDADPAHLTAIGHSYGSTTLGHAAHDEGVPVDDLVFVGSPGVGGDTDDAGDTGVDPRHVWAGANSRDPVADLANHGAVHLELVGGLGLGDDPAEDDFGAQRFRAESTTRADDAVGLDALADHGKYFDPDTESLWNLAQIVTDHPDRVLLAEPVHDPWYAGPQDPEADRRPTAPRTH